MTTTLPFITNHKKNTLNGFAREGIIKARLEIRP